MVLVRPRSRRPDAPSLLRLAWPSNGRSDDRPPFARGRRRCTASGARSQRAQRRRPATPCRAAVSVAPSECSPKKRPTVSIRFDVQCA
ncbi:hypothetical protein [Caudoviricetes sp.]|nr:hypothetical protein [Caudoviricetes sp.]